MEVLVRICQSDLTKHLRDVGSHPNRLGTELADDRRQHGVQRRASEEDIIE